MHRLVSFNLISALLLLTCILPAHQALAGTPSDTVCVAADATSLSNCVTQLENYDGVTDNTTVIEITAMIPCSANACNIVLNSSSFTTQPPSIEITGDPGQSVSAVGLRRTDGFDYKYGLIDITDLSNVTVSNFTLYDDPSPAGSIVVDGKGNGTTEYPIFCAGPDANSTVSNPSVQGIKISQSDTDVTNCPVPGYVTVKVTDSATTGGYDYPDVNTACFEMSNPYHYCGSDQINITDDTNVTISGMVLNYSQGDSVDVGGGTTGFYFLNNTVENAYFRGLSVTANDLSIEGNLFFANRAAGLHVYGVTSSSGRRPSDISGNVFDHNQHGDAFPCGGQEGCSGGQTAIAGSEYIVYGNTFMNGYMDFYDPDVLDESYGPDAFNGCDLSVQCAYYSSSGAITAAGTLWSNGGGVTSGPDYQSTTVTGNAHRNPDVELDKDTTGVAVFSNNVFDYGSTAFTYDPGVTTSQLQLYDNELFGNSQGNFFAPSGTTPNISEQGDCDSLACGATSIVRPAIIEEGPDTAAAERSDCKAVNCLWVVATQAWSEAQNSLALGSSGTEIQCALLIYGPGGNTLLATVQGGDATCTLDEGVFTIPASVAEFQTSVQIAYENLSTGKVSAKQLVTLAGMVPSITATGLGCTGDTCIWITATDTTTDCAVGIYNPTTLAHIMTLSGSQVDCNKAGEVTFVIPASILNNYQSVYVSYLNQDQGTWSKLAPVSLQ